MSLTFYIIYILQCSNMGSIPYPVIYYNGIVLNALTIYENIIAGNSEVAEYTFVSSIPSQCVLSFQLLALAVKTWPT